MIHSWINTLIRNLKRDNSYELDLAISFSDLLSILATRGLAMLRGLWIRPWVGSSGGILFLGKGTTLRHMKKIFIGRSTIIDDHVTIDALSLNGVRLGDNVTIARHTTIQCTGVIQELGIGLEIGNNSAVGAYSFLGAQGGIKIGNDVIMGPMVSIHSENHVFSDQRIPIRLQPRSREGIVIEDDSWIGAKTTILDGVRIGKGSVVAAGAVVTRSIPPNSVAGGVPARVIRKRN
jgi:acetyltransferase-like isoleucine patch superfamily enzyme